MRHRKRCKFCGAKYLGLRLHMAKMHPRQYEALCMAERPTFSNYCPIHGTSYGRRTQAFLAHMRHSHGMERGRVLICHKGGEWTPEGMNELGRVVAKAELKAKAKRIGKTPVVTFRKPSLKPVTTPLTVPAAQVPDVLRQVEWRGEGELMMGRFINPHTIEDIDTGYCYVRFQSIVSLFKSGTVS